MKSKNVFLLGEDKTATSFPKHRWQTDFLQTIQISLYRSLMEESALVCSYERLLKCCKFIKPLGKWWIFV